MKAMTARVMAFPIALALTAGWRLRRTRLVDS